MDKFALFTLILYILVIQVITEGSSEDSKNGSVPFNPRYRQVRNQDSSSSSSGGRRAPPPPAYYVATTNDNGRQVYQIDRTAEKIHEQMGVLGTVLPNEGRRRNSPSAGNPTTKRPSQNAKRQ